MRWQKGVADSSKRVGNVFFDQQNFDEAIKAYRKSLAIQERLVAADPDNTEWQHDAAASYNSIGRVLQKQGLLDEAVAAYRHGLDIFEHLTKLDPTNTLWQFRLAVTYMWLGDGLVEQNKFEEALQDYRDSLAILQRLASHDLRNMEWQDTLGLAVTCFVKARDFATALKITDQIISVRPKTIWLYNKRAQALMFLNRVDEARALYLRYRGEKNVFQGDSWETIVLEDFAELRQAGLTHPLMQEIEKAFAGT
jgi:tetratricopeptide (TPR) repeat protein